MKKTFVFFVAMFLGLCFSFASAQEAKETKPVPLAIGKYELKNQSVAKGASRRAGLFTLSMTLETLEIKDAPDGVPQVSARLITEGVDDADNTFTSKIEYVNGLPAITTPRGSTFIQMDKAGSAFQTKLKGGATVILKKVERPGYGSTD
jgi:hypothetical protein